MKGTVQEHYSPSGSDCHGLIPSHQPSWATHLPNGGDLAQAGCHQAAVSTCHHPWVLQGAEVAHSLTATLLAQLQQTCMGSMEG